MTASTRDCAACPPAAVGPEASGFGRAESSRQRRTPHRDADARRKRRLIFSLRTDSVILAPRSPPQNRILFTREFMLQKPLRSVLSSVLFAGAFFCVLPTGLRAD